jgi:hypothetical protein
MSTNALNNQRKLEIAALLKLLKMGNDELAQGLFQTANEFFIEMSTQQFDGQSSASSSPGNNTSV